MDEAGVTLPPLNPTVTKLTMAEIDKKRLTGASLLHSDRLEEYLPADEFFKIFKCTPEDFKKLPKWKQDTSKRQAKLL